MMLIIELSARISTLRLEFSFQVPQKIPVTQKKSTEMRNCQLESDDSFPTSSLDLQKGGESWDNVS